MSGQERRLDSWKEIAEYLGRDVRTVMRWSKANGLPVRRVAGGRSVFAFTHEIDTWLAGSPAADDSSTAPSGTAPAAPATARHASTRRLAMAAGVALTLLATGSASWWVLRSSRNASEPLQVVADKSRVVLSGAGAAPRELLRFGDDGQPVLAGHHKDIVDIDADGKSDVLVGVAYFDHFRSKSIGPGELLHFSSDGQLRWKFVFDDALRFRDESFDGPWVLAEWNVGPPASPARIAVAAHHHTWWASIAAVLDHTGHRVSTFVNPGWIESLTWLDHDRLAIGGFNNLRNAAVFAVVDPRHGDTQAPGTESTAFDCVSCTGGEPLFYATFPRSELNVITASRFNRAQVSWSGRRIVVTTVEGGDLERGQAATAHYEFDSALRLMRSQYDDRYWDLHRQLELSGRLTHSRETCPERDGPKGVQVWSGATWKTLKPSPPNP